MPRKPMTFEINRKPPAPPPVTNPPRKQVGARIPDATYRQLKARAALDGVTVQSLVEQAIDRLLKVAS
jgi:hypothetical protein